MSAAGEYAQALRLAALAHAGQLDATGAPVTGHLNRVQAAAIAARNRFARSVAIDTVSTAAVLHDIVEDTDVTLSQLRGSFSPDVVQAVDALTHRPSEPRAGYIARTLTNPVAVVVKYADNADNANPTRLAKIPDLTRAARLREKYEREHALLLPALQDLAHTAHP